MRDIIERLEDFEEYAIKTKKYADAGFYCDCAGEINKLRQQMDKQQARIAQLENAALVAICLMPGGQAKAELRDAYDAAESAQSWLLRKQAEAVEECQQDIHSLRSAFTLLEGELSGINIAVQHCKNQAESLRQQANLNP